MSAESVAVIQYRNVEVGTRLNIGTAESPELGVVVRVEKTPNSKRVTLAVDSAAHRAQGSAFDHLISLNGSKSDTLKLWLETSLNDGSPS